MVDHRKITELEEGEQFHDLDICEETDFAFIGDHVCTMVNKEGFGVLLSDQGNGWYQVLADPGLFNDAVVGMKKK